MKKISTLLVFVLFLPSTVLSQVIFTDDFESGTADSRWGTFYAGEDSVHARPMAEAPAALSEGGSYVGWLQDVDASYQGSGVAIAGSHDLINYSIEADVYCYVNQPTSTYTGLVVYADTAKRDFYKMRVDFDASDRINFSGLKSDPNTFMPLYSKDFKGSENPGLFPTESGWHKLKVEVRATGPNETSFWCYFDGTLLAGCPIKDTTSTRATSGSFGLYAFQMGTGIAGYFDNLVVEQLPTVVYTEDFESGAADAGWFTFYANEDNAAVKPMTEVPAALEGGGEQVLWLQDADASYQGSAVAIHGPVDLANYSVEADVYCYVNEPTSTYTGLVVYADTAKKDFYKMRVDFDVSDRINFSGLKSDPNTYLPLYSKDFKGSDNPGLFPAEDGWHKMKIEVRATSPEETSFWLYFDGTLLNGCPITDTNSNRATSGSFGLYTFQMGTGIAGYFDNIVVEQFEPVVSVDEDPYPVVPADLYLAQNYPNPFNPETKIYFKLPADGFTSLIIYDLLGRKVKTLISEYKPSGSYTVSWNGKDESGSTLSSGIYLYTLKTGDLTESKKMMFLK